MKPILFSTPMVQAILDGRKTQTRRIIKAPVMRNVREPDSVLFDGKACKFRWFGDDVIGGFGIMPKYQPDDNLWVRETWQDMSNDEGDYVYLADGDKGLTEWSITTKQLRWKPSIHMPREAARIFLKVTNVSVERLQEITVDDCRLEGCCCSDCLQTGPHSPDCKCDTLFHNVWNDINAKRGYGWQTNPWVWVYEFERVSEDGSSKDE